MSEHDQRPADSIAVLDLHLDYLRKDMAKVLLAVANMATKDDLRALEQRMQSYATKDDLRALEIKVQLGAVGTTLDRWLTSATRWLAFLAMIGAVSGVIYAAVHFIDRVPK
jgi:hypothetical protein